MKATGWNYKTAVEETPFKPMMLLLAFMQEDPQTEITGDEFWATANEIEPDVNMIAGQLSKFNLKVVKE